MAHRMPALQDACNLLQAWHANNWLNASGHSEVNANVCLVQSSLDLLHGDLSHSLAERLERLQANGLTLRLGWPRDWNTHSWIGQRLFLAESRCFNSSLRYTTIACSHLGRDHQQLREWPQLVEAALRKISVRNDALLVIPNTTLADAVVEYSQNRPLKTISISYERRNHSIAHWLTMCLTLDPQVMAAHPTPIWMSTDVQHSHSSRQSRQIQDELAFGLADHVVVLLVRPQGRLERFVNRRLQQADFPSGSLYLYLAGRPPRSNDRRAGHTTHRSQQRNLSWLDQGAVGWYLPVRERMPVPVRCQAHAEIRGPATHQLCAPIAALKQDADQWTWLTHCTRGTAGPAPAESDVAYRVRIRMTGQANEAHPLRTLHSICQEQRIRGSSKWTRGDQPAVSLSEVPLAELLGRRAFQAHLGRWDWEPYGLILDRRTLHSLGARRVVYGTEDDYCKLPAEDKPFFQPQGESQNWSREQEWRLLGHLNLDSLPQGAVSLFTRTSTEARQLARAYNWPVFWLE